MHGIVRELSFAEKQLVRDRLLLAADGLLAGTGGLENAGSANAAHLFHCVRHVQRQAAFPGPRGHAVLAAFFPRGFDDVHGVARVIQGEVGRCLACDVLCVVPLAVSPYSEVVELPQELQDVVHVVAVMVPASPAVVHHLCQGAGV